MRYNSYSSMRVSHSSNIFGLRHLLSAGCARTSKGAGSVGLPSTRPAFYSIFKSLKFAFLGVCMLTLTGCTAWNDLSPTTKRVWLVVGGLAALAVVGSGAASSKDCHSHDDGPEHCDD